MRSKEILNLCLKTIEEKFDQGPSKDWSHKIFVNLSNEIIEKSGIYISVSSLKRLYGKVKYDSSPQKYTLNSLAKYLGYADWLDYANWANKQLTNIQYETPIAKKINKSKTVIIAFTGLLVLVIGFTAYLKLGQKPPSYDKLQFTLKEDHGTTPFKLLINYDISAMNGEEVYIDFDDFTTPRKDEKMILPKNESTITHTYQYSDVYVVKVYVKDSLIKKIPVFIASGSWEHIIALYDNNTYYSIAGSNQAIHEGKLYVTPRVVHENNIDTIRDYWLKHRFVSKMDLDADNHTFTTRVRNRYNPAGNNCPEIDFTIVTEKEPFQFKLFNPGCGSKNTIHRFGNVYIDGQYADLSAFERDLSNWQDVKMTVKDKKVNIYINNQSVFDTTYTSSIGSVYGLLLSGKRSTEIEYIKLTNKKGELIFNEEFN